MGSKIIVICLCVFSSVLLGLSFAQEKATSEQTEYYDDEETPELQQATGEEEKSEDIEYSCGTVVLIDSATNKITVSEYDWESDTELNVVYSVDPKTRVEGISSWKDIPKGTYIDIEYVTDAKGEKVAKYISLYESEAGE